MYLSGTIERYKGTIESGTNYVSNGGTYWDIYKVDPDYENWFETVYDRDHPISSRHIPSHVTVHLLSDSSGTVYVKQQDCGTSPSETPTKIGSVTTKTTSGSQTVAITEAVDAQYLKVETDINTGTAKCYPVYSFQGRI